MSYLGPDQGRKRGGVSGERGSKGSLRRKGKEVVDREMVEGAGCTKYWHSACDGS